MPILCQVCNRDYLRITETHTVKHGLSLPEYRQRYPDAPIMSPEFLVNYRSFQRKGSDMCIGSVPWNKGLTKESDTRVRQYAEKKLGHAVTQETKQKISAKSKGVPRWPNGREFTGEWIQHLSQALKGRGVWNKGVRGYPNPKHSEWAKHFYSEHPEKHPLRIMTRKGHVGKISYPQEKLYGVLKRLYADAELNYPVRTPNGIDAKVRFADIGIPSLKIDVEYDGSWHYADSYDREKDRRRDIDLKEEGWATIRVNKDTLPSLTQHLETTSSVTHYAPVITYGERTARIESYP